MALELEYRLHRGERPTPDEYLPRFHPNEHVVEFVFRESAVDPSEAMPPFLIDHPRYRVEQLLGSGGMGSVYLAEHRVLERAVALKVINPDLLADPDMVERFRSEAKAAARLSHPNVVTVYDAETAGAGHFLVMEYVPGTDLARTVVERGPLPVAAACDYIAQAARGLQHAHQHGMVHRDITPRNLMLTGDGRVKVLDFGLAYFVSEAKTVDRHAVPRQLLGSIDYMAPEQAADPHSADIRADVYSLGCTLYFLLTGQPPFPQGTVSEKIESHAKQPPPAVSDIRRDVPPELSQVLGRMLAKSPADRYQTPRRSRGRFGSVCQWHHSRVQRAAGRRRWIVAAAGVLLCGLVLAGWTAGWNPFGGPAVDVEEPSAEAQRLYREGVLQLEQRRESQMNQAIRRLQSAVELAPDYALAYAALADAYNLSGDYGWEKADDVFPKAKAAAEKRWPSTTIWRRPILPWPSRWIRTTATAAGPSKSFSARCGSIRNCRPRIIGTPGSLSSRGGPTRRPRRSSEAKEARGRPRHHRQQRGQDRLLAARLSPWPSRNTGTPWSLAPISAKPTATWRWSTPKRASSTSRFGRFAGPRA